MCNFERETLREGVMFIPRPGINNGSGDARFSAWRILRGGGVLILIIYFAVPVRVGIERDGSAISVLTRMHACQYRGFSGGGGGVLGGEGGWVS